ncbi:hypothetical protein GBI89_03430 [Bifidobacterium longum]|nr:hypothetical protein GBI76_04825 [Bifidobacterium longum]KAB6957605.1 hypothetical protein GBI89_03430 [Bifidobacterium longum]KAB6983047.1 hypothetical protein GBJ00_04205 [Bifidobacterium longum]KAB6993414.1 hypothetical protein GBJ18_04455 [Bifidobacterium longum]KAB7008709.1 hypothetical protein GBI95_03445 [Bifidobacterium longum]
MFPATVFVSVASGHLTLLAVGQVLQRSLEPAESDGLGGGAIEYARELPSVIYDDSSSQRGEPKPLST